MHASHTRLGGHFHCDNFEASCYLPFRWKMSATSQTNAVAMQSKCCKTRLMLSQQAKVKWFIVVLSLSLLLQRTGPQALANRGFTRTKLERFLSSLKLKFDIPA